MYLILVMFKCIYIKTNQHICIYFVTHTLYTIEN